MREAKDGNVQPQFTTAEVSVLELMERDKDHFFRDAEKQSREKQAERRDDKGEISLLEPALRS